MADAKSVGSSAGSMVDRADHPLLFAFAIVLITIPAMALLTVLFTYLGWSGPAALTQHP